MLIFIVSLWDSEEAIYSCNHVEGGRILQYGATVLLWRATDLLPQPKKNIIMDRVSGKVAHL